MNLDDYFYHSGIRFRFFVLVILRVAVYSPYSYGNYSDEVRIIQNNLNVSDSYTALSNQVQILKTLKSRYCQPECSQEEVTAFRRVIRGATEKVQKIHAQRPTFELSLYSSLITELTQTYSAGLNNRSPFISPQLSNQETQTLINSTVSSDLFSSVSPQSFRNDVCQHPSSGHFRSLSTPPKKTELVTSTIPTEFTSVIKPCCQSSNLDLKLNSATSSTESFGKDNPYVINSDENSKTQQFQSQRQQNYRFESKEDSSHNVNIIPATLFTLPVLSAGLVTDTTSNAPTEEAYYQKRLRAYLNVPTDLSDQQLKMLKPHIGQGANSQVYLDIQANPAALKSLDDLTPPKPRDLLKQFPGMPVGEARELWIKIQRDNFLKMNNRGVIKIRNPMPPTPNINPEDTLVQKGQKYNDEAANQTKRDLLLAHLFDSFSKRFTVLDKDSKPTRLVRFAKYTQTQQELAQGILRQEAVIGGTSAHDIGKMIQTKDELGLQRLGFHDLKDAESKITALQGFYQETHHSVIQFLKQNSIAPGRVTFPDGKSVEIGFDFNNGRNSLWDGTSFVGID